jgi:hypothetical protein
MSAPRRTFLRWLGAGDVLTGAMLIVRPAWVLLALGAAPPRPDIYVRWLGVFVAAIGMATFADGNRWTAGVRLAVCAFVAAAVISGTLPIGFAVVGAWDGIAGALQCTAFGRRRLDDDL